MKKLFLIDGSALVFRSFHALSQTPLTSHGMDVGMIYGFLLSLLAVLRREKPDYFAVTFDTPAPTFRHAIFPEYKANRPPLDESIRAQLPLLYDIIDLLNIPRLFKPGWEADDLMGTLARQGEAAGLEVYLVTGDKDFYQLVTDRVKVYSLPTKKEPVPVVYDPAGVEDKFGVPPEKVIEVLGLMGDSVDNVPGVPGVGPKTAVLLVKEHGSLEAALAAAPSMKPSKVRDNLLQYAEQARLSHKLVVIDTDSPVDAAPHQLTFGPLNNPALRQRLRDLEFTSILSQLDDIQSPTAEAAPPETAAKRDYHAITLVDDLRRLVDILRHAPLVSMDTETTSLDPMRAELVGLSFAVTAGEAWYVAVNHFEKLPAAYQPPPAPRLRPNASPETLFILNRLQPVFHDASIAKTGQNLKYDLQVLSCYDVAVEGVVFDTMIASFLLDTTGRQHNLDVLAETYLGLTKIPTSKLIGSGSKQLSMAEVDLDEVREYACEDADVALQLTNLFQPRIESEGLTELMCRQEIPLLEVLRTMEHTGVALDVELLKVLSEEFAVECDRLQEEIYRAAGAEFNLNSTQQLAEVLYTRLKLPAGRKTKFGYSTDIAELERLAPVHEVPAKLLRYRHLAKLKSTYIDALPLLIHPLTGRVHTTFSQTVAATGRLSSTDPNLQNIPIRTEEGGRIRKAFIAGEPGWRIVSADYSQIELRIMAHLSGDQYLLQAFREGQDIHRATAAWMHDLPPE